MKMNKNSNLWKNKCLIDDLNSVKVVENIICINAWGTRL